MPDQTTSSIEIAAEPHEVMAVIADFEAYPQWVDSLKSATVLTETDGRADEVRMVLEHPMIKDDYTLAYQWGENRVSWNLVRGNTLKAMDGSYQVQPTATGSRVTYTLRVDVTLRVPGMLKRKAEKTIIDGALRGLKKRVEGR